MEVATDEWIQSKNIDKTGRTPHTTPQGGAKSRGIHTGLMIRTDLRNSVIEHIQSNKTTTFTQKENN